MRPVSGPRLWFWFLPLLLASAASHVEAKVFSYPQLDCKCTIPDSWTFHSQNGYLLSVSNWNKRKFFCLRGGQGNLDQTTADLVQKLLARQLISNGYTIQSQKPVVLHGLIFQRLNAIKDMGNKTYHVAFYQGVFQGFYYLFDTGIYDSDPADDPELIEIVNSITFPEPLRPAPKGATNSSMPDLPPSPNPGGKDID